MTIPHPIPAHLAALCRAADDLLNGEHATTGISDAGQLLAQLVAAIRGDTTTALVKPYLSPVNGYHWLLRYWSPDVDETLAFHDPLAAIGRLARTARARWDRVAGLTTTGFTVPATPPENDLAASNLYFWHLADDAEGFWLERQPLDGQSVDDTQVTGERDDYVLGHVAGEWICVCGNDAADEGFDPCTRVGALLAVLDSWDGVLYRCVKCDRIVAQPTGQVVGRAE
ncbi:hypothetical protein [Polymorphospora sp. NPDC050346]|uniref:hypothetical protein n=1 Tax=Polymorphospora sp. NPDC050346 TaxID=3155780 RepID=UPI0033CAAF3B